MPTAVHGLRWAAPTSWMHGHAGSAQLCFAWLESQCMSLVGRGVAMVLSPGLWD